MTVEPCTDAHDAQVFAETEVPDQTWDAATLPGAALKACEAEVGSYFGSTPPPGLHVIAAYPQQSAWDGGDRDAVCAAYDPAHQVVGDIRADVPA